MYLFFVFCFESAEVLNLQALVQTDHRVPTQRGEWLVSFLSWLRTSKIIVHDQPYFWFLQKVTYSMRQTGHNRISPHQTCSGISSHFQQHFTLLKFSNASLKLPSSAQKAYEFLNGSFVLIFLQAWPNATGKRPTTWVTTWYTNFHMSISVNVSVVYVHLERRPEAPAGSNGWKKIIKKKTNMLTIRMLEKLSCQKLCEWWHILCLVYWCWQTVPSSWADNWVVIVHDQNRQYCFQIDNLWQAHLDNACTQATTSVVQLGS